MGLIEEVSDDEPVDLYDRSSPPKEPLKEPTPEPEPPAPPAAPAIPAATTSASGSANEYASVLSALSAKLALPEDLLPSFMGESKPVEALELYRDHAERTLREIDAETQKAEWTELEFEQQAEVLSTVVRLHGEDDWTSMELCEIVDRIVGRTKDLLRLADHILSLTRTLFAAQHPSLSTESRARIRPAGGAAAMDDLHEGPAQAWKGQQGWGCHNLVRYAATLLQAPQVLQRLGQLLPPTLTMMDDWEPAWRGRGAYVLSGWAESVSVDDLRRRGLDSLLLKSLLHTLSLHADPRLPMGHVMPCALDMIKGMEGEKRSDAYGDVMENALIAGWAYAPSGEEGTAVLIDVAGKLEVMVRVLGTAIIRWLKSIVPNLLHPLQYPPTPFTLPLFKANLSALLVLLSILRDTARLTRWRGQVLDIIARTWVQISERQWSDKADATAADGVKAQLKDVVSEVEKQCPSVRLDEFRMLRELDTALFVPLVGA